MRLRIIIIGLGLVTGIVLGYFYDPFQKSLEKSSSSRFNVDLLNYKNIRLRTHRGEIVKWGDFANNYRLVYFGYGSCPDICPVELTRLSHLLKKFDIEKEQMQPIFVTVDPDRDTVEFLKDYVGHFHPELIGITGSKNEIRKLASAFKVFFDVSEETGGGDYYLVDHTSAIFLINPKGEAEAIFGSQTSLEEMESSISLVLRD